MASAWYDFFNFSFTFSGKVLLSSDSFGRMNLDSSMILGRLQFIVLCELQPVVLVLSIIILIK